MKSLLISCRIEAPRSACIKLDKICWGTLPVKVLQPFFVSEHEQEIDPEAEARLLDKLESYARDLLFDYLSKSEHSEASCRSYLKRKRFHPSIIDESIKAAKELGFLSDQRFAEIYIRSLLESGKSRRYIIAKLKIQKITPAIYNPIFEEYYDPEDSIERLSEELIRLCQNYGDIPLSKKKEKAYASLYRRGWELELISKAWNSIKN